MELTQRTQLAKSQSELTRPLMGANLLVGMIAVYDGYLTSGFGPDPMQVFILMVFAFGMMLALLGRWRLLMQLKGFQRVSQGSNSKDDRLLALGELQAISDKASYISTQHWLAGVAMTAGGLAWLFHLEPAQWIRLVVIGALMSPVLGVAVNLVMVQRVTGLIALIAQGLTPREMIQAMPLKGQRLQLKLVVFTAVMVIFPAGVIIDASHRLGTLELVRAIHFGNTTAALLHARAALYGNLALLLLAVITLVALIARAMGAIIADPLRKIAEDARRLAKGESITAQVYPGSDEVWAVTANFGVMVDQLNGVLGQVKRTVVQLGSTTEQMIHVSTSSETLAGDQATSLNETSATTEELAQSARQISSNASSVEKSAQRTLEAAKAGQTRAEEFFRAVKRMRDDNGTISEAVQRLNTRVQQIGKVVELITSVADRSDLLALSAELEGTKAGDLGRGFTLVAAEMRRLAENVIESTKEIEALIDEIKLATDRTVIATGKGLEQTLSGTALATQVAGVLDQVVQLAERTSEEVRAISLATQQQQSGTDQLAEAMADILGITQQSLAATKQLSSANAQLVDLTTTLDNLVATVRFGP